MTTGKRQRGLGGLGVVRRLRLPSSRWASSAAVLAAWTPVVGCGGVAPTPPPGRTVDASTVTGPSAPPDAGVADGRPDASVTREDAGSDPVDAFSASADAVIAVGDAAVPPSDASLRESGPAEASADAPATYQACDQGTNVLSYFVAGSYGGLPDGAAMLTELGSAWVFTFSPSSELEITSPQAAPWGLSLSSNTGSSIGGDIALGTFGCDPSGNPDYASFWVNGDSCSVLPQCSLTIQQLNPPGGSEPESFKASFSFTCPNGGAVTGCINYRKP